MTHAPQELSTQEAAAALGVTRRTIHRWVDNGTLPVARKKPGDLGAYVFRAADVAALADERLAEQQRIIDEARARLGAAS